MTSAWFLGATHGVPQDSTEARSTVEPIRTDAGGAEESTPPAWNEVVSDESGQLVGLSPRVIGSHTIPSEQTPPLNPDIASNLHDSVSATQSTKGTAAARELAGQRGHGSMQYEIGIDPLNPAQRFGNDYFVSLPLTANEGGGDYMTPIDGDHWAQQVAQASANDRSRQARQSSLYNAYFK